MFGGIDPRQMQSMMKKMGIKTEEIDATEVIIKGERNLVIKNPKVTLMEVQGQKTFQIMGDVEEAKAELFTEEDVMLVAEKSGKTKEEAKKALEDAGGDIAEAILTLGSQ